MRKIKEDKVSANLFGCLTADASAKVHAVQLQAKQVILTTAEDREAWLCAPWEETSALQRPMPNYALRTVLKGPKQGWDVQLVTLAERASKPHAALPLYLFARTPNRPDDAATLAEKENLQR